jgi:hypothetical protein
MTETKPQIDYGRIDFPSDRVTLKQLRAKNVILPLDGAHLEDMHVWEKDFARLGFLRERGARTEMETLQGEMDAVAQADVGASAREHLSAYYVRFGIADGPETAEQFIRRLEAEGAAQSRQQHGRHRS